MPRSTLLNLKTWLGHPYRSENQEIRTCIVQATLEHLFEQEQIREFFPDWQKGVLSEAYSKAAEWYEGGGCTPLGSPSFVPE